MRKLALLAASVLAAIAVSVPLALASASASTVNVTEKEFTVKPSKTSVKAGAVTFKVKNAGGLDHSLAIVKTSLAASKLPQKNGLVTLKALKQAGPFKPGKGGTLTLTLKPGTFVLYCNVAGHYQAGQYARFVVK